MQDPGASNGLGVEAWIQVGGQVVALLATIAAWLSAREAKRAVVATQAASNAAILGELLDSYSSDEMLDAMLTVRKWCESRGNAFADEFAKFRHESYETVTDVDKARRRVSHHFHKVYRMLEIKALDQASVRLVATHGQVTFLREFIEPLERAINPAYNQRPFEVLGDLYGIPRRVVAGAA